ncbi:MAG: hypothetical protein ACMZI0_08975 [Symbiopectobacterium sp.]|uniref:hypothetical protein n=1 Tax=Symbiopectobacterium sp. TaxID=2952789 RepID=UPI0039EAB270
MKAVLTPLTAQSPASFPFSQQKALLMLLRCLFYVRFARIARFYTGFIAKERR